MLLLRTFQMGLIIYVSVFLLTPKFLSLLFDPRDYAFLSWAHSHTAFHNLCNYWVSGVPPLHQWMASRGGSPSTSGKGLSPNLWLPSITTIICDTSLIWWHLTILKSTGATLCTLTMDIMWLFAYGSVFAVCSLQNSSVTAVAGFLSSCMEVFKLQMVAQTPVDWRSFLQLLLGAPGSETLNMKVRRIGCLTNLGTMPLTSLEAVTEWEWLPFP